MTYPFNCKFTKNFENVQIFLVGDVGDVGGVG